MHDQERAASQAPTLCTCCEISSTEGSATLCWQCEDERIDGLYDGQCLVLARWERMRARGRAIHDGQR